MFSYARVDKHEKLRSRMADTLGVDVTEELMRGRVTEEAIAGAAIRCTTCRDAEACESWLAAQDGAADAAPDFCRNTRFFSALKHD